LKEGLRVFWKGMKVKVGLDLDYGEVRAGLKKLLRIV